MNTNKKNDVLCEPLCLRDFVAINKINFNFVL